ncbi:proline-, glutamic acid- and leucine-rich protein 1 [Diachasma alloeum]|uniref:proline-, glutamic acid- and leucine-rich protein 1 n=1 Tax=Diachasma alloeum TaxID=454923 RepID=UPI0007383FFE|nr:proline-, glutamic acid- and leucine-rich protein 1 [Diachasma alloeum]
MSKILNLYKSLDQSSDQCTEFIESLLSTSSDLPLSTDEVNTLQNSIISAINSRLNDSGTRHEGLKILSRVLPTCSQETLSKYGSLWLGKATQHLESPHSTPKDTDLSCKVLSKLVISCKEIPELQKQISMQNVKQLIALISSMTEEKRTGGVFFVLATLLCHYREPCERLQSTIQKLIIPPIDSKHRNLVQAGANCFTLLAKATERSFKPPETSPDFTSIAYQQALISNDLHVILDELFSGVLELDTVDIWGSLELPSLPQENVVEYYHNVERRFQNLCVYLATTLRGCAGKNSVSCRTIMKLVCRGLAVAPENLSNDDSYKKEILYLMLPKIQMSLLNVLNAFINGFRGELVPFALTILQLYRQTLKWTGKVDQSERTMGGSKPFKTIRIGVYRSLSLWLNCLGSLSGVDMIAEDILPNIVRDVTPERDQVLLTIQKTQNMSKKALKKFKDSQYESSMVLGSAPRVEKNPLTNAELCREALVALQNIFYNSGVSVGPGVYRALHKIIVPLLLDVYMEKDEQSLYSKDSECRLNLLRALRAIQMNPSALTTPPTQYSIQIFQLASNDGDEGVVREARVALAELEKIVHPSAGPLDFAPPQAQEDSSQDVECIVRSSTGADAVDRIRNIVEQINNSKNERLEASNYEDRDVEKNKEVMTNGKGKKRDSSTDEIEVIRDEVADDDIEVIENGQQQPPRKQRKIQIVEDICIPPRGKGEHSPKKTPSIEEIPQDVPERYSQDSFDSNRGESAYFTIKDAQRVSANSSTSSDQPVEIIKEISLSKEISIIESESKSGSKDDGSDDEVILSMFCDQIKD